MTRIAVVEEGYGDIEFESRAAGALGVEVVYRPCESTQDVVEAARGFDGILVRYLRVDGPLLDQLPSVRVVGRYGVGVDNVDVDAATERGVAVVNVPDYCTEEVAEHAAALIFSAWRKLPQAAALIKAGRWDDWAALEPIRPLSECTLGLVGTGRISRELLRKVGPSFGRVLAFDPYASEGLPDGVEQNELDALLGASDVVSLHCPLTAETHHLMNRERLALMRPDSLLVNVSRGGLIDTTALLDALAEGRPGSAALDVLETEPARADDPIANHPQVLLSPHVAWYSTRSEELLRTYLAERCAKHLLGQPGATIVNPQVTNSLNA
jgi:D-3-phosphoglycerate dehydrogenase